MNYISITLNENTKNKIEQNLIKYLINNNNPKVIDKAYYFEGHSITLFKTNVLLIQGKNCEKIYEKIFREKYKTSDFDKQDIFKNNKEINQYYISTIGSDEVGVGDFFGGLCVCAAYVDKKNIKWLKSIGVKDSKKLSDSAMLNIYEKIKTKITFVAYNIDAQEYNRLFNRWQNAHIIKAILHNQCLWDLSTKVNRPYSVIIDEFVNENKYIEYLQDIVKTNMFHIDVFSVHAEDKYIAVACASIIARVLFLKNHEKICLTYNVKLPLGSSNDNIKKIGLYIIDKYGLETLANICKNHFKTFSEIKEGNNYGD